jgi:uncharacterized alkaline shock family protein YloU
MADTTTKTTDVTTIPTVNASGVGGKTDVQNGVVAKIAGIAARDVVGVFALGGGAARAIGAIRTAMNNTDLGQGVSVEVGETQAAADLTIVVEYPANVIQVADQVRAAVAAAIEDYVGLTVTEVNVDVVDVHIPSDDDAEQASA